MGFQTEKIKLTADGSIAILLHVPVDITVRVGEVLQIGGPGEVIPITVDVPAPIGIALQSSSGNEDIWVAISGIAPVLFNVDTSAGQIARGYVTGDSGYETGCALQERIEYSYSSIVKVVYIIGHIIETVSATSGYALAKVILQFN